MTLAVVALGVVVAVSGQGQGALDDRPQATPGSPNIVLILTDDLALDDMRFLPQTTRLLGEQGVTFTEFLAPQPLCCPSRAQLLTGQYAQNNGVRHNNGPYGGYQAFSPSTALPVWLQEAGYQTAMVGKYLNGYGTDLDAQGPQESGWDHWDPTVRKVYDYYGYRQYDNGDPIRPREYHTDYVARQSEELIASMAGEDRPFFLWSSFVAPHGVCKVAEEAGGCESPPIAEPMYRGTHPGAADRTVTRPSFDETDVSGKPGVVANLPRVDPAEIQDLQGRRADALSSVDDAVADIVGSLRDAGELDDTLVVFTSDNGYLMGEHRFVGKVLAYEESVRVPLLARGPGIPAGAVDDQTAAMIDLAPTFAAVADATPLVPVDGDPIVLRRRENALDADGRTLLLQAGVADLDRYPSGWWYRGVRTARYTYIGWERSGFVELYDRRRDAYQLDNLAEDPRYAATRAELARRTRILGACSGDTCRTGFGAVPDPGPVAARR